MPSNHLTGHSVEMTAPYLSTAFATWYFTVYDYTIYSELSSLVSHPRHAAARMIVDTAV